VKHQAQVRAAWRSKSLTPVGLPCGVVAIDGKGLGALEHDCRRAGFFSPITPPERQLPRKGLCLVSTLAPEVLPPARLPCLTSSPHLPLRAWIKSGARCGCLAGQDLLW